jgi:hypothetical protein
MTHKEIKSDLSQTQRIRDSAGIVLIFAGLISLGIGRVLIGTPWGPGIEILTFFGGVALVAAGFYIQSKKRR